MKKILLFTLLIVLIPLFIIGLSNSDEIINKIKYGSYNNKAIRVKKNETEEIINVPIEEYVIGVVAGEMPASFNEEALKAQAVASRTYALNKASSSTNDYDVTDGTQNQVYISYDEMKDKWQDNYEVNLSKIQNAVLETKGEVVLYNNNLIDAMFFSTSNGYTENSGDVFSSSKPYLVSVSSAWDKTESPVFNSTNEVSKSEFLFNLGLKNTNDITISNVKKTNTGRVISLTINGKNFDSDKIRSIFNLRSTSFNITVLDNAVLFNVSGYGHGVGMSQYGANGMAKEGYNYKDILKHYYKDCDIKKIN
jgi:stage II sporulation protein D